MLLCCGGTGTPGMCGASSSAGGHWKLKPRAALCYCGDQRRRLLAAAFTSVGGGDSDSTYSVTARRTTECEVLAAFRLP
jgi:hypothetical protein